MTLVSKTIYIFAAFFAMTESPYPSVETECAESIVTAEYEADIPVPNVEAPFGYWRLREHEVRVNKATLLRILNARVQRILRSGLEPYGSLYLTGRINSLGVSQWPVDMATLAPSSSEWDGVETPEPRPEIYLASKFYRLSMQGIENTILLENALFHAVAEIRTLAGQVIQYSRHYSFEHQQEDDWVAIGDVWTDPDGIKIYESCRRESVRD